MKDEFSTGPGEETDLALPGDTIRVRHIASRAKNRRQIVVLVDGDAEFVGYSIGLDACSLQLLEIPSGEVSTISRKSIVAISDGKQFAELSAEDKGIVDRRTASFRKTSHNWLVANWPEVYDRPENDDGKLRRIGTRRPPVARVVGSDGRSVNDVDAKVRE